MSQPQSDNAHREHPEYQSRELQDYVKRRFAVESKAHARVLERMKQECMPAINIGPLEGRILEFLARSCAARKAVEIGTLGGYSAIWIGNALAPGGKLWTLEYESKHAEVAIDCLKEAGLDRKVQVIQGDANETLKKLEPLGPFDFVFIDADKVSYPKYLRWAAANLRPGGIVAADNAYLFGQLHLKPEDAGEDAPRVRAMHEFVRLLTDESLFSSCAMLPTGEGIAVGVKA